MVVLSSLCAGVADFIFIGFLCLHGLCEVFQQGGNFGNLKRFDVKLGKMSPDACGPASTAMQGLDNPFPCQVQGALAQPLPMPLPTALTSTSQLALEVSDPCLGV